MKGGIALGKPTDDYGRLAISSTHGTVGPFVEFHLPARWSLEFGAMYSSYKAGYPTLIQQDGSAAVQYIGTGDTRAWDFPGLIKYRLPFDSISPFVSGGVNYRRENSDVRVLCATQTPACTSSGYSSSQDRLGPAFGAGVEWKLGRLKIAPEFRYMRLNRPAANQFGFLLGFSL